MSVQGGDDRKRGELKCGGDDGCAKEVMGVKQDGLMWLIKSERREEKGQRQKESSCCKYIYDVLHDRSLVFDSILICLL